ncbi:MAG: hypothetical protein LBJ73_03200 [Rickettsiales bacterium]|jgi:hypothetical protein|nr:hypothetical protein [Rickettsiales bacterium]
MRKLFTCFFLCAVYASAAVADDATLSRVVASSKSSVQTAGTAREPAAARPSASTRMAVQRPAVVETVTVDEEIQDQAPVVEPEVSQAASAAPPATTRAAVVARTVNLNNAPATELVRGSAAATRPTAARTAAPATQRAASENAVRTGRNARVDDAGANTAAARRAGTTTRPSIAAVGGRATIAGTGQQTGSNVNFKEARSVQTRASVAQTKETIAEATERLQQTSDLNKSCQQQYNDCMDQFCAVIDANQKRCSCSANLSKYSKVESAVKDANTQLNDVAQRIRYVGLSADEIRAIMSATEAELELSGKRDNTESRSMLEEIENLIKNPSSATSYSGDTYSGLDMDLDFSGEASDLFTLDFLGTSTSSFSNLRGRELYNAAKKRCNTVLNQCKGAGATTQQITGNYDLAIDKDCIAYEQGLGKMNDTLKNNVRSANNMLQKARLAVLQNKNQYDAKGCIAALNTCMTDEMVCGADYTKCLDPTKKYIDENGSVVLGQRIADITDFMEDYNNAEIDSGFLNTNKSAALDVASCKTAGKGVCVARYLLEKIGTGKTVNDGGLCRAVLDKCQRVSYDSNSNYLPYNDVIVNYIQRAMVNIQAAQKRIISDYAANCMVDIASCYNQQVSQVNAWLSTASVSSVYNVMRGACRNVALTCAYAVFANDEDSCSAEADDCINSVSEIFYQSLLCPENSSYDTSFDIANNDSVGVAGWVNNKCKCNANYAIWGSTCTRACPGGMQRNSITGVCETCSPNYYCTDREEGSNADSVRATCTDNKTSPAGSNLSSQCS